MYRPVAGDTFPSAAPSFLRHLSGPASDSYGESRPPPGPPAATRNRLWIFSTRNPNPVTQNPEPGSGIPDPGIRNQEPGTRDPEPETRNPRPGTRDPRSPTRNVDTGVLLPNNQRQHRTWHAPKDVLPLRIWCAFNLCTEHRLNHLLSIAELALWYSFVGAKIAFFTLKMAHNSAEIESCCPYAQNDLRRLHQKPTP